MSETLGTAEDPSFALPVDGCTEAASLWMSIVFWKEVGFQPCVWGIATVFVFVTALFTVACLVGNFSDLTHLGACLFLYGEPLRR